MACNTTRCIAPTCCNIARRMPTADPGSAQPVARNRHRTAHHIVSKSRPQMGHRHASCDGARHFATVQQHNIWRRKLVHRRRNTIWECRTTPVQHVACARTWPLPQTGPRWCRL
jgi:hypothetical protein